MGTLRIRDAYGNEFDIDTSARPFWEGREGYEIVPDEPEEAVEQPEDTGTPKTTKRAARAAQDVKEQPDG